MLRMETMLEQAAKGILQHHCSQPITYTREGQTVYIRCGSKDSAVCPGCSKIAVDDWAAIVRSDAYEAGQGWRWYLLTLTAPSLGTTHRMVMPARTPRHCRCGRPRDPDRDSGLRGLPIDTATYDYASAVRWNRDSSRLWDVTRARLSHAMPSAAYAAVREWQSRG